MANDEHLKIFRKGAEKWNRWRKENPAIQPDLSGADFSRKDAEREAFLRSLAGLAVIPSSLDQQVFLDGDFSNVNFQGANFHGTTLYRSQFKKADLSGADLTRTQLIETDLRNTTLTGCQVYGASVWGPKLEGATQNNLVITPPGEPVLTVDDLEIAQFIYLLLNYNKFRDVIDAVTKKGVLILGRFGGGGLEVLQAVAAKLREETYLPIIFEFDRPRNRNLTETVITLVGLARFVIVDLSGPSVPHELEATVPHFNIPFVPILENERRPHGMFSDFLEKDWVLKPLVFFKSIEDLIEKIPGRIIAPAEKKLKKIQTLRAQVNRVKLSKSTRK